MQRGHVLRGQLSQLRPVESEQFFVRCDYGPAALERPANHLLCDGSPADQLHYQLHFGVLDNFLPCAGEQPPVLFRAGLNFQTGGGAHMQAEAKPPADFGGVFIQETQRAAAYRA